MLILNGLASPLRRAGLCFEARRARTPVLHSFVLSPERAIEGAVLDSLGDVLGLDRFSSFQVGGRPSGYDTVMSSGSQALLCHCAFLTVFRSRRRARRRHECAAVPFERCNRAFHVAKKKIVLTAIRELEEGPFRVGWARGPSPRARIRTQTSTSRWRIV
jgi:hypothetical protein